MVFKSLSIVCESEIKVTVIIITENGNFGTHSVNYTTSAETTLQFVRYF